MDWNYLFFANLSSAVVLSYIHLINHGAPWYLTAILLLNIVLSAVSSLVIDWKNIKRDERIEQLEKELQELKQEKGLNNETD